MEIRVRFWHPSDEDLSLEFVASARHGSGAGCRVSSILRSIFRIHVSGSQTRSGTLQSANDPPLKPLQLFLAQGAIRRL